MIPSSRPEFLNVPEYNEITTYTRGLGILAVRLAPPEVLPYHQDQGVIYRIVEFDEASIGDFNLQYDYDHKKIGIDHVRIKKDYQGKGIGSALYRAALTLPLPDGGEPRANGFVLESHGSSNQANEVWEWLVKRGLAEQQTAFDRHYIMR